MAAVFPNEAMQRLEEMRIEQRARLASQASHFTVEPDPIKPGGWIVRNPKVPYRIELVNAAGECTCNRYRLWDRCKHSALVLSRQDASCLPPEPALA